MKSALTGDSNYLKEVREQYEQYPYPPRDPNNEKSSFRCARPCALDCLNYYHYSGKRDFTKGFRALVAGGGTGDVTITLAEQFRGLDAEIIQLDISTSSLQIAKERAKVRGLDNITWIHGSLLDAQTLFDGQFDLIESSGVLHHLEDPEAGLAALAPLLKDDGVMSLMLYARYGRASVYQMQELMRMVNKDEPNMQHKVDNCKNLLKYLPAANPIMRVPGMFFDIKQYGDIGIYDLFLHSHDRAYSVPEVYRFLASSGLQPTHFFFENQPQGNDVYNPEVYFKDGGLSNEISHLSLQEKQAAAELMNGTMAKHSFYAAKYLPQLPGLDDSGNVPFFYMTISDAHYADFYCSVSNAKVGDTLKSEHLNHEVFYTVTPHLARICKYMDGTKSLGEIFKEVRASYAATERKPSMGELSSEFKRLFSAFNKKDMMFLRHKSVPKTIRVNEINARMDGTV